MSHYNTPTLNKVMIVGNVVSDPRISATNEAKVKVANFRIACNRKFRTKSGVLKEEVCFVSVTAWLKLAEICEQNLRKGDRVYVEGSLQSKTLSDGKTSVVEILAERIQILTPKKIVQLDSQGQEHIENLDDDF
jgi:single-strand DNA-binding protein